MLQRAPLHLTMALRALWALRLDHGNDSTTEYKIMFFADLFN